MTKQSNKEALLQGNSENPQELFREYMRDQIRTALWDLMQEEVRELCGPKYEPSAQDHYRRAGSEEGVIFIGGKRQSLRRPRVRQRNEWGQEREVGLRSYQVARGSRSIEAEVTHCMAEGMSTRSFERMGLQGASRSTVSRRWVSHSLKRIQELRGRSLSGGDFFGLILDGVFLSRELSVLICIGLCRDGAKRVLDFEVGSSENYQVCHQLLARLQNRGLTFQGQPFVLLDGSQALEKGVLEFWSQAAIQRCLIHKERNLHGYLRRKDHSECSRLMKRLRQAQGPQAGREALKDLQGFLAPRSKEAFLSLQEAGERLITLHLLDVPSSLNTALLSTNLIENLIRNYRRHVERVCRWRTDTDQVCRWTAQALLSAEAGFQKIRGYQDLPHLLQALGFPLDPLGQQPSALHPMDSAPARRAPASCPPPCSPPGSPKPERYPNAFLPPTGGGGTKMLSQPQDSSAKLDSHPIF